MRRSPVLALACISACALEAEPPGIDPATSFEIPPTLSLGFAVHTHDECSQSWAATHDTGRMTIEVDRRQRARLRIALATSNISGSWNGEYPSQWQEEEVRCEFDGRARWEAEALVITLRYPKRRGAERQPYQCDSSWYFSDVERFELRCGPHLLKIGERPEDRTPTREIPAFACELDDGAPSLLRDMTDPWESTRAVFFGDEQLNLEAEHEFGDDVIRYWVGSRT